MNIKYCTKCKIEKSLSEFGKNKSKEDGLTYWCKKCLKKYREENKEKIREYGQRNYKNHKEEIRINQKQYNKNFPWKRTMSHIKYRCNNPKCKAYNRYGGRGIKCLITEDEIKQLWIRDKTWLLKQPCIDRIDNDGNYEFSNCEYIERGENTGKDKRKPVIQYDLDGKFIKEWESQAEANYQTRINNITCCCKGKNKTAGGFIWKYKKQNRGEKND